jgi:hypothetical protein
VAQLLGSIGKFEQLFGLTLALGDGGFDSKPFFRYQFHDLLLKQSDDRIKARATLTSRYGPRRVSGALGDWLGVVRAISQGMQNMAATVYSEM